MILFFISFKLNAQAGSYSIDYTDISNSVSKYTDSSIVLPAIRKKMVKEINNINSSIYKTCREELRKDISIVDDNINPIKISQNNINFFLLGFYQEFDKSINNKISSKYFFLVSIPKIIRGHLLKEIKCYNFLLTVQNEESVSEDELSQFLQNIKGSIDIYSQNKYWSKLKSFKREIIINDFKPFNQINNEINKYIR